MNAARLALNEIRRLTASRLACLALVALVLVPTLYAGLYLWANKDPYAEFPHLPVAVVSEDAGTTLSNGKALRVGPTVAEKLVDSHTFDWHDVSREQADRGVQDGTYAFAVVMPRTFSADLASSGRFDPRQAKLTLLTNDANNYMTHTIGNQVIQQVSRSVASELSTTSTEEFLGAFGTIRAQMTKAVGGADQLRSGAQSALDGASKLKGGSAQLLTGQRKLSSGADQLEQGAGSLESGAAQLDSGATKLSAGATQLSGGAQTLSSGLSTLDTQTANLPSQTDQLATGAEQVAAGNAQIATTAQQVARASSDLRTRLGSDRAALLARLRAAGLSDAEVATVSGELDRLATPVNQADDRVQQTSAQLTTLSQGSTKVAQGARRLANSAPALSDGIHRARTGSDQLASGAKDLASGATTLASGAGQLHSGATTLHTGAKDLAAGERQAVTGTEQLDTGLGQLVPGLTKLRDGAKTLHDEMAAGVTKIPNPTQAQREAVAQTLGNPIAIDNDSLSAAGTYGAGLAPFFMSLALWIGAYVLFLLVRPLSPRALAVSAPALRTAVGGWAAPALVGAAQVVGVIGVVWLLLRLPIAHPLGALAFLLLASASFVAIIQFLAARFGSVGKFMGLVLMVVQLVSGGGTFPWQTLPGPLQAVHHVVPMSYAIDGLRRLMYGGSLAQLPLDVLVLAGFLLAGLLGTSYAARRARIWTPARIAPDLTL